MNTSAYEAVIGLEIHVQLSTASKIFSPEAAHFGADANTQIDAVSLGYPGTLPVLNREAVAYGVRLGLATGCTIARHSLFARKQYFYPDLPKGYQISQYDTPIGAGGWVEIEGDAGRRRIGLTRIHLEEDAGKSLHGGDATRLDFNRCGTPLVEMVTEPDLRSPEEAGSFLTQIRRLVRYLGICDGNMEEGSLRCDANVSLRPRGETRLGTKAEVKNLNSIRNVERALHYEIARQTQLLDEGGAVDQETRLWDADRGETRSMRGKEEAHDYRYFPDPDLVPMHLTDAEIDRIASHLPELPEARQRRFIAVLGLPPYDAQVLTDDRAVADYFEAVLNALDRPDAAKVVSNVVMTDVLRVLAEQRLDAAAFPVAPARLADAIRLRLDNRLSSTGLQELFGVLLETDADAEAIAAERGLLQVSDDDALAPTVEAVLADHPAEVARFQSGETKLIGFFVGQVMRRFSGSPDPQRVRALLLERLSA